MNCRIASTVDRPGGAVRRSVCVCFIALLPLSASQIAADEHDPHRLSAHPIPLQIEKDPPRPMMLFRLGEAFQNTGQLHEGYTLPTGAVWHPALWVYGNYRSAIQNFNDGRNTLSEWVNRFDLFAHLRLSGTEMAVASLKPMDQKKNFTGYYWEGDSGPVGWQNELNYEMGNLFFQGELGQIVPALDSDIAFTVGKQPLVFQEGMLFNDALYGIGVAKNSLHYFGVSNLMVSLLYGWGEVNRESGLDENAQLFSFFTEGDLAHGSVNANVIYVISDEKGGDGLFAGASSIQRLGRFNSAIYANASLTLGSETDNNRQGVLLFAEFSVSPYSRPDDIAYFNSFLAVGPFSSGARQTPGPLGRAGILFEPAGMGRYGAALAGMALSPKARDVVGAVAGYQAFLGTKRRQLTLEVGGRKDTDDSDQAAAAAGLRFQQALGRRFIIRGDVFATRHQVGDAAYGTRLETVVRF